MPAPKFRMRGTTAASETEATQKKTSTAPKFRMRGAGGGTSPSLPTVTSQAVGETAGRKKAGRPTTAGKLGKITSPAREAERRAEELRTLRDEAHQEFLNFRGAEITAGAAGMPTEPYTGQRYRTAEEAYRARQDYDRQLAELRNRYYQEENEQQRARLAEDASMQASFARADEIRGALNRIQTLEQTRAAAPGPVTEDAVNQAVREIAGQYGLSREDSRNLTTVRKALEAQLLEETDRISTAGYDYERMTEYQKRQERAAEAERQRQQTEAWADEHPVLASLASVGASALQAVDIPRLIATGGGSEDDLRTYTPADPNAAIISNFVTGVRDTVSKKIVDNTDWELFGQNVASFLYNTGMSIGDSASQVALLGPWATYLMGASAASQQAVNVLERGGSNSQAFWGGLAAGAAEAVFERFSIEKLLEAKTINSVKDLLRATARQAGTEASEEMLTEIANILSDTAIMGESSDFEQLVAQYQLMGMDEDEARKQAYLDSVAQVVWAGVGGALSGAAMGGGLGGVDLAGRNIRQRQQQTTSRAIDAAYDTMQREGLFSPAARQATEQAQQRIDAADRREARAYNNNYMGRPQRQASRDSQAQQDEQGQAQGPQNTQAAVNVEELEQSAAAAGVAEADVRAAAEISRATGREIRFYDGTQRQDPSGRANGYFDGDTIYVNSRSANPVAQIISHELTHSVEMADAYRDLSSLVFDRIQKTGGDLERLRQEKQAFYAQNGKLLRSQKEVDQEIVAEYVEHTPNLYQIEVPASQAAKIIGKMPDIMDPENSILGDFFDDYWESGPKRSMINRLAREYDWTLGTLATDIFRDHPTEYRQAVRDVLGYDGVQVNFPSGEKHFIAWFPNQIKHATENSGAFSPNDNRIRYSISEPTDAQQHPQGARRIRKTAEPSTAAQDEADRLFFQGVDADTIREETGLERTEDHGWRFAVDTAQAAAYDGGRTTDQQGGADNGQDTTLRGIYGEDVRGREAEETNPGRLGSAQRRNAASSQTDEGRGRTAPASWARGRVIDQPSIAAGIAVENAGRYGADAFVVEDAAIKEKNPNAWALTSGGSVYISDSVPEELAGVVGYHEAVHAARQQGQAQYRDFLENTGDYIDFTSNQSAEIMDMILGRRFPGRESLLDLTQREQDIAFDELNALVWGYHKADPENARAQFADMFQDYDAYIADLDAAMESGAEPEIPGLSLPTLDDEDIRYSMDEDSAAAPDDSANQTEQSREESAVAALPPRAQNYLKSVERKLLRKMGNSLSVPRWARREFLAPIVRDISEAYLVEGRVPAETMDNLFDEAYEQGVVAAREYYDEYKELRDYLRNTKLEVSQEDAAGIPDFNDFRKSNFGRLNISTKSGKTNVDQVYQELSARWPEFFNEDRENNIPDQLERIAEVSKSFRIVEQTLDEYYGDRAADFRQYAKHDFEAAVTDLLGELRNVMRYADASRQPAEAADQAPATLEEVNALWTDLKEARRTYEKAEARNLLTDSDEAQVGRLLRGEIEPRHLNPERDNVRGITEVYQAKREYERITGLLRLWNQSRKAEMRTQAEHLLETANAWKDKKSGILYARETMERNIRDIVPDRQLAEQIIETYFKPVHRAAADSNRLKNRYRDQVRGMHLSRKVAKGNTVSEAHAVQLLGEAEDNIRMIQQSRGRRKVRDGKTLEEWQAVIRDLWETSPHLDQGKIRNAVQTFRTIYDELFQQMNDARVRNGYEPVNYRQGYFPHFQPGDGDGILATFGRALGISTEVTALPTTINGLTHAFRPGIQWFGNAQERLGFNTAYDAVEGFDRYIEGVADVIYQTDNIQRLRTLATEIRYRTGDEGIRRQIDRVRDDPGKNDEEKRKAIEEITEKGRFALSNFVVELDEYTNLLANKKSFSDRNMERNVGRTRLYNLARWLEGRVAANMVAVNPASWLTNFIPLTQGGALLDRGMLLRGMWDTLWSYKESDGIAERSSFLVNRRGSDPLVQTWGQKASVVMSRPMSYIDTFTADSLVRARYRQNLKRGMSEDAAMADADAFAANVMADRSKGATPTLFNRRNPMTKLFTQFQLEVNNQLSYVFKDIPREKRRAGLGALAAALFKFVLGAWLYDEVYEFLIGRRPALDPIGILNDTVGDLTGWEVPNLVELGVGAVIGDAPSWQVEEAGLYETAGNLGTALAEELPFIGGLLGGGRLPIGSAIPDFGTLRRAAMDNEWAPEKRLKEAADELAKPAAYLALPFGGGQIKRVFEAIDAVRRGGVYTLDAEGEEQLQYPVYNDTSWEAVANGLRAAVFGRTSLPTGREWVESGFDTLSAKQTAAYKGMVDVGVPGEEAYSLVQELQGLKAAEQRKTLRSADISGDGKSVVYYAMMASDDEMALMDALAGQNADMGEVTRVLMEMKDEARKEENKRSTVDILSGASLTDGQKAEIFRSTGSDSLEEKLSVAEEYGISGGEWMEAEEGFAQEREEAEAKSLTQEIAEAVIRNMDGLDRQERAAMWQLQNKGWNWKSNPFDRKVGREIYDQQHAEDED